MQRTFFFFLLTINFLIGQNSPDLLQIRDVWSGKPVQNAFLITAEDTLVTDEHGVVLLDLGSSQKQKIEIKAKGYFPEFVSKDELKSPVIYLIPVEQTTFITVVRPRVSSARLSVPSHQTYRSLLNQDALYSKVTDLLSQQSGAFVKSYGPAGSLKTIAIRGMSAEQTQVLLDGIPLNNLQLGSVDLSVYDTGDIGGFELYRGSNALLGGSGAIGGSINLQTEEPADELRVRSKVEYSSLKNKSVAAKLHLPFKSLRNLLSFSHSNGLNRYSVKDQGGKVRLKNRDYRQSHLSYKLRFNPLKKLAFKFYVSHFKKEAGSPKPFTGKFSEESNRARTTVDNTLLTAQLRYRAAASEVLFQAYLRNEWMTYRDPSLLINYSVL
ncbi:MAG: TonB-dependent receptor plug domain-containing protein, partial [Calditrichaeota bacterium]|nr:TonB-dependent receptor plug domain-containing protein [Calditrichota bacterium]